MFYHCITMDFAYGIFIFVTGTWYEQTDIQIVYV